MNVSGVYVKLLCLIFVPLVEPNRIAKVFVDFPNSPNSAIVLFPGKSDSLTRIVLIKLDLLNRFIANCLTTSGLLTQASEGNSIVPWSTEVCYQQIL